jgi:hypothetical protein
MNNAMLAFLMVAAVAPVLASDPDSSGYIVRSGETGECVFVLPPTYMLGETEEKDGSTFWVESGDVLTEQYVIGYLNLKGPHSSSFEDVPKLVKSEFGTTESETRRYKHVEITSVVFTRNSGTKMFAVKLTSSGRSLRLGSSIESNLPDTDQMIDACKNNE